MKSLRQFARNPYGIAIASLFLIHIFFMFYELSARAIFGYDQVDNAWAAATMFISHKYPLLGMVAKGNSGIYIGPLYYYFISAFYFFTRLHPIASPIIAGVTSLAGFWIIWGVAKRLFNRNVALVSSFIYTFSVFIIKSERVQWPVNFIAPLSLLIFYFLYKIITGQSKFIIHLAVCVALMFHVHFTAVFFPIIILLSLPLVPMNISTLKYTLLSIPVFSVFFIPQIISIIQTYRPDGTNPYTSYLAANYHGFHLRRVLQIAHDAFIQFEAILGVPYKMLRGAVFYFVPAFYLAYYFSKPSRHWWKLFYIIGLWIAVPWAIFATYKGEISDYYFSIQLYLAVIILGYLTVWIWERKQIVLRLGIAAFWLYFAIMNMQSFFSTSPGEYLKRFAKIREAVDTGHAINFTHGDPESYIYFYLLYTEDKPLPYKL